MEGTLFSESKGLAYAKTSALITSQVGNLNIVKCFTKISSLCNKGVHS